jgi:hypothetical protein
MRPTPAEVIAGVRRILKEAIEPELTSDYARSRLTEIRAVLAQVDWDDSATALARGNAEVAALAERAMEFIERSDTSRDAFADCRTGLEHAAAAPADIEPFAAHARRDRESSQTMIDLSQRLTDWLLVHDDPVAQELLDGVRRHFARASH